MTISETMAEVLRSRRTATSGYLDAGVTIFDATGCPTDAPLSPGFIIYIESYCNETFLGIGEDLRAVVLEVTHDP